MQRLRCLSVAVFSGLVLSVPTPPETQADEYRSRAPAGQQAEQAEVAFQAEPGRLRITIGGRPFASYVYEDAEIPRPYFAHVRAPNGVQVTRTHPPRPGIDQTDHATYHPGVWLAFADINGADFWRNRARIEHAQFVEPPRGGPGSGSFVVRNEYRDGETIVCEEVCRYQVLVRPAGYLLIYDSEFRSDAEFAFGDQEEMGLGVRVATPLSVEVGSGRILDSEGRVNEPEVWGQPADWCDYSGTIDGRALGVMLMPAPDNFRRSWFHARDYGLMEANVFGRRAFTGGKPSRVVVRPGESLRLRFGVLIHASPADEPFDPEAAYRDFLQVLSDEGGRGRRVQGRARGSLDPPPSALDQCRTTTVSSSARNGRDRG